MSPAPGPFIKQGYVTADTALVTTAETVAATVSGISTEDQSTRVAIRASVAAVLGTAGTGVFVRIRRGVDATGAVVGEAVFQVGAATQQIETPIEVQDVPGAVAGQSYVVTVQQNAATGNGNIVNANIVAEYPVN